MRMGWLFRGRAALWAAALVLTCGRGVLADTIVYSNNGSPGDAFTNASGSNTGQAVGSSGWYYNNVRNNGVVGVNTAFPRNGNGSVLLQGPNGSDYKSDISYFNSAATDPNGNYGATSAIGSLNNMTTLSYDWYRDASSSNSLPAWLAPTVRIGIAGFVGGNLVTGYLIWEQTYNGYGTSVPTDTWVHTDALHGGNDGNIAYTNYFWGSNAALQNLAKAYDPNINLYGISVDTWTKILGSNFSVIEINSGIGSGWGGLNFKGAVDNIAFGFGGSSTTYNFEAVPEPSSVALALIAGGAGLAEAIRRRRSR